MYKISYRGKIYTAHTPAAVLAIIHMFAAKDVIVISEIHSPRLVYQSFRGSVIVDRLSSLVGS